MSLKTLCASLSVFLSVKGGSGAVGLPASCLPPSLHQRAFTELLSDTECNCRHCGVHTDKHKLIKTSCPPSVNVQFSGKQKPKSLCYGLGFHHLSLKHLQWLPNQWPAFVQCFHHCGEEVSEACVQPGGCSPAP